MVVNVRKIFVALRRWWRALSLATQFGIAAALVVGCGMALLGAWVGNRIEQGVVQNTAGGAALFIDSLVEPHVQELRNSDRLSEASIAALEQALQQTSIGRNVVAIKIWARDGMIAYSNHKPLIGRRYTEDSSLQRSWNGEVVGQLDRAHDDDYLPQRLLGQRLFEIYAPIRENGSSRIIAVAEVYESAEGLVRAVRRAWMQSWIVVGALSLGMLSLLVRIVRRGSQIIEVQDADSRERISELSRLLRQNEELRRDIDRLHKRSVDRNERVLRRVGAELHDGPAQMIGLALLRLDALRPVSNGNKYPTALPTRPDELETIRSALQESLTEIRNISSGLALPAIDRLSPADALVSVVQAHERRTGTHVSLELEQLPAELSLELKTCLYRFVQEGLNNAYRHAQGAGQAVKACFEGGCVEISVHDRGPGIGEGDTTRPENGLGLVGLRDRVTALGGSFEVRSNPGEGTELHARFEIERPAGDVD